MGGAAAVAPVTAPLTAAAAAWTFLAAADASILADFWSSVTDDIEEVKEEPPVIDLPVTEEPDDGCFAEGTVVLQSRGRRTPIERIGTGDLVASRQEASLEREDRGVTHRWRHEARRTIDLTLDTGESVRTTAPHQFFTADRGLVPAGMLRVGDRLETLDGAPRTIVVVKRGAEATVYNLTVAESHTFFVGEAGVWVHNDKATTHEDAPPPDDDDEGEQPTDDDDDSSGGSGSSAGSGSGTGEGSAPPPA